jgi:hypothetical protein
VTALFVIIGIVSSLIGGAILLIVLRAAVDRAFRDIL